MSDEEEFQRVHAAMKTAGLILGDVLAQQPSNWDYMIVAAPAKWEAGKVTMVPLMSSVPPEELPFFIKFIDVVYAQSKKAGRIMNDLPSEAKPS